MDTCLNIFDQFPKLQIDLENVAISFRKWLRKFELSSRLAVISMGTEKIGKGKVLPKFRGEMKLLALLNAIGSEGMEVLESVGFDLNSQDTDAYDVALNHLKNYYDQEENEHVAWVKAATLSQLCGESDLEFLLQVEKHSRNLGFEPGTDVNALRKKFATSIALAGLRNDLVRQQLLLDKKLTWETLSVSLKAKSIAGSSYKIFREAKQRVFNVGSGFSASVNRWSFHNGHLSNNSRNRDEGRFKVDFQSKYSFRNKRSHKES